MTTANELAQKTIEVLELQKLYFKQRDPKVLQRCKYLEMKLMIACKAVLAQQGTVTGNLFEQSK
jgi:hypothetical protein